MHTTTVDGSGIVGAICVCEILPIGIAARPQILTPDQIAMERGRLSDYLLVDYLRVRQDLLKLFDSFFWVIGGIRG